MLIITGDDLGRDSLATDSCLECFRLKRITSASLMVFMKDSERAAELAVREEMETGLHINLVAPFDGRRVPEYTRKAQETTVSYFRRGAWTQVAFNPFILKAVETAFDSQLDEFRRLFRREPAYLNGHKHLHLSLNMILGKILPYGSAVRRGFSFKKGEKSALNRGYRRIVDIWLKKRFVTTDSFFSLGPVEDLSRLRRIVELARDTNVELMVHPWRPSERAFLMGKEFEALIAKIPLGDFASLRSDSRSQP